MVNNFLEYAVVALFASLFSFFVAGIGGDLVYSTHNFLMSIIGWSVYVSFTLVSFVLIITSAISFFYWMGWHIKRKLNL